MTLTLKSLMPAYGGFTIARDEKVIFIRGAIPGEVVEVEIEEKKRDYFVANALSVLEPSEDRVTPPCPVFGQCGGCQLQFVSYDRQLTMKDEILSESLARLGGIEHSLAQALSDVQWGYRHRAQLKVSRSGEIGFFRETSRSVVAFAECRLLIGEMNTLIGHIRDRGIAKGLTDIHITSGGTSIALLRGGDVDGHAANAFIDLGFAGIALNEKMAAGTESAEFSLAGLKYTVSPWTFIQAHWSLNQKVVDYLLEALMPLEGMRVLDLYAGAGNFSLPLAKHAKEVVAVEENPYAAADGIRNAKLNRMKNCRFVKSSAEKYVIRDNFDIVILDPPRPGLTKEVLQKIREAVPPTIAYFSCNPATLARDLRKLADRYEITSVRQIDMFPNTFHIEALAFLRAK